jgi:hypothetical protein
MHADDALTATLLYRLASYWLPLPIGGIAYVLFRLRHDGIRSSRTGSGAAPIPAEDDAAIVTSSDNPSGR